MLLSKRPDADRFLNGPPADVRAAVIHGRDRGGVRERADILAGKLVPDVDDPFDVAVLTDGDLDAAPARLEEELAALSMLGGRRLIRLRLSTDRAGPEKLAAEALVAHLDGRLNPEAFLLVEAGALDKASLLRKTAEAAKAGACIPVYDDEAGDVARMVRESLARDRVSLTQEALDLFVARLPRERGVARREIERVALYAGPGSGASLDAAALEACLGVEPEASLFDAAVDAFGGRGAPAQAALRRAVAEGETGPAAVRAMSQHLGKLRRVLTLARSGADLAQAAKSAGVFWKQEREFLRQARGWTLSEIDQIQPDVLDADRQCKRAGSPDALIAERLMLAVAMRARRLGL